MVVKLELHITATVNIGILTALHGVIMPAT